jgi:predicted pyridoxine 5'-phosphate oxidase superfamily flavin-nucleotide-binding protein
MRTRAIRTLRRALGRLLASSPTAATAADTGVPGERILQGRYGTQDRAQRFYDTQMLDHLNETMREFVARQPMMFLATSDARGECDNTFRAGPAGFVRVLNPRRLAWPEYRGNGVLASLGNILENPHVGLLFVDFFDDGVGLHVNGGATILDDDTMRAECADLPVDIAPGRRSTRWVVTNVTEAYIHCSKFIPRLHRHPADGTMNGVPRPKKPGFFVGGLTCSTPEQAPLSVSTPR